MECSIQTTTKLHEIRSTISNVSKLPFDTEVVGPDFYLAPECKCSISFKKDIESLCLYICNKSDIKIKIVRSIMFLDCNYTELYEETDTKIFSLEKNQSVDMLGLVDNSSLYDHLINDTLIIDLRVSIKEILTKKISHSIRDEDPSRKLRVDLKAMLENPVNSDVSLQVGDEKIPAHWSILCSRSPYFRKMFYSEMTERVQNSITFTDLSLRTLKMLLEFLYTAEFDKTGDVQELFDMYYAADKYELMDLKTSCAHKIMNNATAENACRILQLAQTHYDKDLKDEVIDFIQNQSEAVFKTEGWEAFKANEPLAAEIFSFFCLKKN